MWVNVIFLIIGGAIGFLGALGVESKKRNWANKDLEEKIKNILEGLEKEIEEGISRCDWLIRSAENSKISFSQIYTAFWDSAKFELMQNLKDSEMLIFLHKIYYYFDLINFNMEKDRFDRGAAFAKEYIDKIKENFNKFVSKIRK